MSYKIDDMMNIVYIGFSKHYMIAVIKKNGTPNHFQKRDKHKQN